MSTPSDLTLTGQALILAMINAANPSMVNGPVSDTNVTLGTPTTTVTGGNTAIIVTGVDGQGYTTTQTFTYNRLDIQTDVIDHSAPGGATLGNAAFATVADLMDPLNAAYNLGLVADDIDNGADAVTLTDGAGSATVTMAAGSLKYLGSLAVTITQTQSALATAASNTVLDGLTPPAS